VDAQLGAGVLAGGHVRRGEVEEDVALEVLGERGPWPRRAG
jgi:hypothetical protein